MTADAALVDAVRAGLADVADPDRAEPMRRYMKSAMPFRGVAKPERAALVKRVFTAHPLSTRDDWVATVLALWRDAGFREERYAATDLTGYRPYQRWQDTDLLGLYEELVVTGAWWDHVDEIASRRVGPLLRADPARLTPAMRRWAHDTDRWKRRTSIICQLGSRRATDTELLAHAIEANVGDPDFFLRKAIGWALREHSRTDPAWVVAFVAAHPGLSPLSRREALRNLPVASAGRSEGVS